MRQLLLDLIPEMPPRLDNFVIGGDGEAVTGLAAWLLPENQEVSLLLWGESGAGKSHLLRASGAHYLNAQDNPDLYPTEAESSANFYAVDNVESLSASGQIALFNRFNRLRASGGRLLTAANLPPKQLNLREDLRTRLGSGLIYRLQALSDLEKREALLLQAAERGLRLPNEAIDYLLTRTSRDMRSLMAHLQALDRYSLEHKRAITLPLLRELLHPAANTAVIPIS